MKKITRAIPSAALLTRADDRSAKDDPVIAMLQAVAENGSINKASKAVGLSYKATWERIETINNLSPTPLVARRTGGSGGGGTVLTQAGHDFLKRALLFRQHLEKLVNYFQETPEEAFEMLKTLKGMEMKLSARNVWLGNVSRIDKGAVSSIVTVGLKGKDTIVSAITDNSVQRLGLKEGKEVLVIVKATSVMLSLEIDPGAISARNILHGEINRIISGAVSDEVVIDIAGGNTVTAILTRESVRRMGFAPGQAVTAIIKASSVLLAIP